MNPKQAIKASFEIPDERKAFIVKKYGGYCNYADLNSDFALVLAVFEEDTPDVRDEITNYPFYRLVYTSKGTVRLWDDKKKYQITPGTFYCFSPGESSRAHPTGNSNWEHYILNFTGSQAAKLIKSSKILKQRVVSVKFQEQVETIMNHLVNESMKQTGNSQMIAEYYLRILLIKLNDWILENSSQTSAEYLTFIKCKKFIAQNFQSINSIAYVADACNISKQHLCRLFKKYHNTTALNYMHKLKLNRIVILLLETNLPINQIASDFYYEDPFYFSKVFKKYYGVSPQEYRQQHQLP